MVSQHWVPDSEPALHRAQRSTFCVSVDVYVICPAVTVA